MFTLADAGLGLEMAATPTLPQDEPRCVGKRIYRTSAEAWAVRDRVVSAGGDAHLFPFSCSRCAAWHLGRRRADHPREQCAMQERREP